MLYVIAKCKKRKQYRTPAKARKKKTWQQPQQQLWRHIFIQYTLEFNQIKQKEKQFFFLHRFSYMSQFFLFFSLLVRLTAAAAEDIAVVVVVVVVVIVVVAVALISMHILFV